MAKIYHVNLTDDERTYLLDFIKSGERSARKINRARILLLAHGGKRDRDITYHNHCGEMLAARPLTHSPVHVISGAGPLRRDHGRAQGGAGRALGAKGRALVRFLLPGQHQPADADL